MFKDLMQLEKKTMENEIKYIYLKLPQKVFSGHCEKTSEYVKFYRTKKIKFAIKMGL